MKELIAFVAFCLMLSSCKSPFREKGNGSFQGVYIRELHDEFTTGYDTLDIQEDHQIAGGYTIEKRIWYRQTIDQKPLTAQYKVVKWSALLDETTGELTERKEERIFRLNSGGDQLFIGTVIYNRIK